MTDKTDSKEREVAEQWLRDRYGAYRGHFAWRELEEAFLAGRASLAASAVSGPLMGKPQEMPDLSALTERGAKAWAGVDAQGLRDGVASVAAIAPAPSWKIKEPYTLAEIKAKIASNDYSAELMLQHAMLHLDRLAASAGSEPVAWVDERALAWLANSRSLSATITTKLEKGKSFERPMPLYLHHSPPEGMVGGCNGGSND